jgi:hypothetical protein
MLIRQEFLIRADSDELKQNAIEFSKIILDFRKVIMTFIGSDKAYKLSIFRGGG